MLSRHHLFCDCTIMLVTDILGLTLLPFAALDRQQPIWAGLLCKWRGTAAAEPHHHRLHLIRRTLYL